MTTSGRSPANDCLPTLELFPTSSLGRLPARTSAAPTPRARASTASGRGSSLMPSASSERSTLVGSLLRTALISELEALTPSSLRWRQSATPLGRSWSVLATAKSPPASAPITTGRAPGSSAAMSSSLPTPRKSDAHHGPEIAKAQAPGSTGVSLVTAMAMGTLATPRKTDADRGFRGDVLAQLTNQNNRHAGMAQEALPTPTKRDKRMDRWSPAYDKRKSPTMDAVLDGAQTGKASDKWAYARQIASLLSSTGLIGPSMTLPITYGWMMGYPPGWLSNALRSAVLAGRLPLASSSKRSATP